MAKTEPNPRKIVYHIFKRDGRLFWNRVGEAFVNSDGSINVKLESLPINGDLQIRDYVPREPDEEETKVIDQLEQRAERICRNHGLPLWSIKRCKVNGAYSGYTKLGVIEYTMHEVAHAMGLGKSLGQIPRRLAEWNSNKLGRLTAELSDGLEIDASAVTYFTGERLGLWVNYERIRNSCFKNVRKVVLFSEWDNVFQSALAKPLNQQHASDLVDWIKDDT